MQFKTRFTVGKPNQTPQYPYLGKLATKYCSNPKTELIVFFTEKDTGIVLHAHDSSTWEVGQFCDYFAEDQFEQFIGTVTVESQG